MHRSRERVAQTLAHQQSDLIPYHAHGGADTRDLLESLDLPAGCREYLLTGEFRVVTHEPEHGGRERFGCYVPGLPEEAELSYWGVGRIALKSIDGHPAGHRHWHPLAEIDTVAGLGAYPFPTFSDDVVPEDLAAQVAVAKADGFTVVGQMSQTILETAYLMRGLEQLFADFYERPDYVDSLFGRLAEMRCVQARVLAEAGVDVLRIGDDIATQDSLIVGPALYRERIKPYHAATIAAAREVVPGLPVLYHSDGNLTQLLADLIDAGVTAINPVQPECMDLRQIKREFGRDLTLWGCMPVQSLFVHGTGDDVSEYLRFLRDEIAVSGGLVLQFVNMLVTPQVSENLRAFFEAYCSLSTTAGS